MEMLEKRHNSNAYLQNVISENLIEQDKVKTVNNFAKTSFLEINVNKIKTGVQVELKDNSKYDIFIYKR
jgi:hypothetical protein